MPGSIAEQADLSLIGGELGEHHLKRSHRLVRIGIARLLGIAQICSRFVLIPGSEEGAATGGCCLRSISVANDGIHTIQCTAAVFRPKIRE